jgi:uncharacterized protein
VTGVNLEAFLTDFVTRVPEVVHAVGMSADGQVLATTSNVPSRCSDQLAALGAGMLSLQQGAATVLNAGRVISSFIHMDGGFMFTVRLRPEVSLLVLASTECDIACVGQELTMVSKWIMPPPLDAWLDADPPPSTR